MPIRTKTIHDVHRGLDTFKIQLNKYQLQGSTELSLNLQPRLQPTMHSFVIHQNHKMDVSNKTTFHKFQIADPEEYESPSHLNMIWTVRS
jgi:hypothetical protein